MGPWDADAGPSRFNREEATMTACEKCWADAYRRAMDSGRPQAVCYAELLEERHDQPCTDAEQAGTDSFPSGPSAKVRRRERRCKMPLPRKTYSETSVPVISLNFMQDDLVFSAIKCPRIKSNKGEPLTDTAYYLTIKSGNATLEIQLNARQGMIFSDYIDGVLVKAGERAVNEDRLEFHDYDLDDDK
jgi:hypothetical protein